MVSLIPQLYGYLNYLDNTSLKVAPVQNLPVIGQAKIGATYSDSSVNDTVKLSDLAEQVIDSPTPGTLYGANLSGHNLQGIDLTGVELDNANLAGANLNRAVLTNASLYRANLTGTSFFGTDLRGADLSATTGLSAEALVGARLSANTVLPFAVQLDLDALL
ncbi:pentapeptide repeat-containing protein [Magnetospira sp. QH-2]|uniref:pentapeptide repeat-containing protein n=1 Tax=Magnetospira sp. (strain QH-2) TaxID=1288970 RepID=UPI0003E81900|nr:pentapeptide repeat-containing protein [Magnetospira sp. QH-2]CCQ75010.1 protein of unknown function with pentapeptide repeats [Magnetospira sp. QH-2]